MAVRPPQIVYGVFKGMGDLLWAVPVIAFELSRGSEVHLLIFPSTALANFCSLVDFGPDRSRLSIHTLPRTPGEALTFVQHLRRLSPTIVWISPHAPSTDSSWKVPLALWIFKRAFWPSARLVGASSERLSGFFDVPLFVDRKLPLKLREWSMYHTFRNGLVPVTPLPPRFDNEIMDRANQRSSYDLVIHPGASAKNRIWPPHKYQEVIACLPRAWKIAILGLPEDLEPFEMILPRDRSIEFITGSLRVSLMTIASARLLLVVDSGNLHFADVLGRPTVAIFGKDDPATVIPPDAIETIYEKSVPCQPCGRTTCSQSEPFCLTNLSPEMVANRLMLPARERKMRSIQLDPLPLVTIDLH